MDENERTVDSCCIRIQSVRSYFIFQAARLIFQGSVQEAFFITTILQTHDKREILKLPSNFKLPGRKFLKKQSDIQESLASVSFGVIQACYIKVIFVIMAAGVLFPQKHRSTSPLFSSMMSNSSDVQPVALMPPFALCKSSPLLIVFFDQERRFQPSSQEAIAALINESRFYLEVLNL